MRRALLVLCALTLAPAVAAGFCGFYVGGADAKLFNNATMVVMMRSGTRTVLSMQNNYQGPPERFAMVVPVPVVLQKENVKTLPREVFDKVDQMAAPRLVEYWEQDPCNPHEWDEMSKRKSGVMLGAGGSGSGTGSGYGVKIEAQFTVGEYEVVVLSASDSNGLDRWLRDNRYSIPEGAEPLFKPYIAEGWKFFVAKVDVKKVQFKDGQAMLSPLRFHYDSEEFRLPVRLGLINSGGTQDLIVHILAPQQRYQVANYKNVTIPTNLDVAEEAKGQFGELYAALFDATLEKNPGAVVTEYAWDARTCDPCPGPRLDENDFQTLGADALPTGGRGSFVLTRLHARYGKESLGEDLVFEAAPPILGGREMWKAEDHSTSASLEHGATPGQVNNFQGRYIIRHPWTGKIECEKPERYVWGGPPSGGKPPAAAARDLAFAKRGGVQLAAMVKQEVPELGLGAGSGGTGGTGSNAPAPDAGADNADAGGKAPRGSAEATKKSKSCGCRAGGAPSAPGAGLAMALLLGIATLRRRRG